jgi:hypothetical protein
MRSVRSQSLSETGAVATLTTGSESEGSSSLVVAMLVAVSIGLPSALLYLLPVSQRVLGFGLFVLAAAVFVVSNRTMSAAWLGALVFAVLLSSVTAWYWGSAGIILFSGYFGLSLCLVGMASIEEIRRAVEIVSTILLALVILAWISVSYAFQGGEPLFDVSTPGQPLSLYLSSLALSVHGAGPGTVIRPTGVFDEPGAFAFFISLCAACRIVLGLPAGRTVGLLLGGFVTTSLALLVFVLVLGVGQLPGLLRRKRIRSVVDEPRYRWAAAVVAAALIWFVIAHRSEIVLVGQFLMNRLEFTSESGRLTAGDSRSVGFFASLQYLNSRTFFFGADSVCFTDVQKCYGLELGGGGTPVAPLIMRGLFSQFLYYFLLLILLSKSVVGSKKRVYLAVALMFLQRPYILAFGYSTWAVFMVMIEGKMRRGSRARFRPQLQPAPAAVPV